MQTAAPPVQSHLLPNALQPNVMQPNGLHILADLWGVESTLLCSTERITEILLLAARAANATVLRHHLHSFGEHQGVTGVLMLAESHLSIHTWPEHSMAAIDIFICGSGQSELALNVIQAAFRAKDTQVHRIQRGVKVAKAGDVR